MAAAELKTKDEDEAINKILEKYSNDPRQLAKGYAEAQALITSQGSELGTVRKTVTDTQVSLNQMQDYATKAEPYVKFYEQNKTQMPAFNTYLQAVQTGTLPQPGQQPAQAAVNTADHILNQGERDFLMKEMGSAFVKQYLEPFQKQIQTNLITEADRREQLIRQYVTDNHNAFTETYWKTQEQIGTPEARAAAKSYHERTLAYADPSKNDPFKMASADIAKDQRISELEAINKTHEDAKLQREQVKANGVGSSPQSSLFGDNKAEQLDTYDKRQASALQEVQNMMGPEDWDAAFPPTV